MSGTLLVPLDGSNLGEAALPWAALLAKSQELTPVLTRLVAWPTMVPVDGFGVGYIPPETFDYRLGNRSALEWVIDQYQVSTDKRSGIVTDPNRDDDPESIVRLVEKVVRVSVETVAIVRGLPAE